MINDFFIVLDTKENTPGILRSEIKLNKEHDIFKGHFPGMPIVPGICMIQIIKEVLSIYVEKDLLLKNADSIKFLSIINPQIDNNLFLEIEYKYVGKTHIIIKSKIFLKEKIFMKLSGTLSIIDIQS